MPKETKNDIIHALAMVLKQLAMAATPMLVKYLINKARVIMSQASKAIIRNISSFVNSRKKMSNDKSIHVLEVERKTFNLAEEAIQRSVEGNPMTKTELERRVSNIATAHKVGPATIASSVMNIVDLRTKGKTSQMFAKAKRDIPGNLRVQWEEVIGFIANSLENGDIFVGQNPSAPDFQVKGVTGFKPSDFVGNKAVCPIHFTGERGKIESYAQLTQRVYLTGAYTSAMVSESGKLRPSNRRTMRKSGIYDTAQTFVSQGADAPVIMGVLKFWKKNESFAAPASLTITLPNYATPIPLTNNSVAQATFVWMPLASMADTVDTFTKEGLTKTVFSTTVTETGDASLSFIEPTETGAKLIDISDVNTDSTQYNVQFYTLADRDVAQQLLELIASGGSESAYDRILAAAGHSKNTDLSYEVKPLMI